LGSLFIQNLILVTHQLLAAPQREGQGTQGGASQIQGGWACQRAGLQVAQFSGKRHG